jgi:hypothetical protein
MIATCVRRADRTSERRLPGRLDACVLIPMPQRIPSCACERVRLRGKPLDAVVGRIKLSRVLFERIL